jgi:hypothetical protein
MPVVDQEVRRLHFHLIAGWVRRENQMLQPKTLSDNIVTQSDSSTHAVVESNIYYTISVFALLTALDDGTGIAIISLERESEATTINPYHYGCKPFVTFPIVENCFWYEDIQE